MVPTGKRHRTNTMPRLPEVRGAIDMLHNSDLVYVFSYVCFIHTYTSYNYLLIISSIIRAY